MAEPPQAFAPATLLARPVLLAAGLIGLGLLLRPQLQAFVAHPGAHGPLAFVLLAAAACAIGLPRQAVAFAAGFSFGVWQGAALALAAQLLGCLADLLWARSLARSWVRSRLAGRFGARLARLDGFLAAHPFNATLTLRLLPVGNNLALNLLAGAFGVPASEFLAASAIGYLPQTAVFTLLGSGVQVAGAIKLALGAGLFAVSAALGTHLLRVARRAGTVG